MFIVDNYHITQVAAAINQQVNEIQSRVPR